MNAMRYLETSFLCRLTTDALFPPYQGSMLRGCLGASLRAGLCMTRARDCATCLLAAHCVFTRIFSPLQAQGSTPPFCLEPDPGCGREFRKGDAFSFRLKLFSYAADYLPFFVQAFRMAGEHGLGSPRKPGRYQLEMVSAWNRPIYNPKTDDLEIPEARELKWPEYCAENGSDLVKVVLLTPLRHKNCNHYSSTLEFRDLFHLILRRSRTLSRLDGTPWQMDAEMYAGMAAEAGNIVIKENNLNWRDWSRYSSRQSTSMKFGGLIGDITYAGNLSIFKYMLHFAQIAHIGKQSSFGLGQLAFEYL